MTEFTCLADYLNPFIMNLTAKLWTEKDQFQTNLSSIVAYANPSHVEDFVVCE